MLFLGALASVLLMTGAQTTQSIEWMNKAVEAVSHLPIRCKYKTVNNFVHEGVPAVMELEGTAIIAGRFQSRTELTGVVYPVSDPFAMSDVAVLTVTSGSVLWWETTVAGVPHVTRAPTDDSSDLAPIVGIIEELARDYVLKVVSLENGRVTLKGTHYVTQDYLGEIVLDMDSAMPLEIRLGPAERSIHMEFRSWTPLDRVNPELFTYTPPMGVQVQSIEAEPDSSTE